MKEEAVFWVPCACKFQRNICLKIFWKKLNSQMLSKCLSKSCSPTLCAEWYLRNSLHILRKASMTIKWDLSVDYRQFSHLYSIATSLKTRMKTFSLYLKHPLEALTLIWQLWPMLTLHPNANKTLNYSFDDLCVASGQ